MTHAKGTASGLASVLPRRVTPAVAGHDCPAEIQMCVTSSSLQRDCGPAAALSQRESVLVPPK